MLQAWTTMGITPAYVWDKGLALHSVDTAIANGAYTTEGSVKGPWTGVFSTTAANQWSGLNSASTTVNDYFGQLWPVAHQVKEVWIRLNRWSTVVRFRAGDTLSTLQTIRTISLAVPGEDDFGIALSSQRPTNTLANLAPDGFNKFKLPDYPAAKYFVIDAPTYGKGIASDTVNGNNTRLGMLQAQLYGI